MKLQTKVEGNTFIAYSDEEFKTIEIGILISNAELAYINHGTVSIGTLKQAVDKARRLFTAYLLSNIGDNFFNE